MGVASGMSDLICKWCEMWAMWDVINVGCEWCENFVMWVMWWDVVVLKSVTWKFLNQVSFGKLMSKLSFIPQCTWATMRGFWAAEALSSKRMLRYSCNNSMQLFVPQLWKKGLKRWKCFRAIQYYIWLAQRVSWWHVLLCMLDHPCPRHCIPAFQPALYHELRPSLWTDCGWRFIALGVLGGLTMVISRWMNLILLRRVFNLQNHAMFDRICHIARLGWAVWGSCW